MSTEWLMFGALVACWIWLLVKTVGERDDNGDWPEGMA